MPLRRIGTQELVVVRVALAVAFGCRGAGRPCAAQHGLGVDVLASTANSPAAVSSKAGK